MIILHLFGSSIGVANEGQESAKSEKIEKKTLLTKRINIILVGATSSLAKKYLWQSFFRLYLDDYLYRYSLLGSTKDKEEVWDTSIHHDFRIYAGATRDPSQGIPLINEIVRSSTSCTKISYVEEDLCKEKLEDFYSLITYAQLKNETSYIELAKKIDYDMKIEEEQFSETIEIEEGRLFYLSISPDFYPSTAGSIASFARPKAKNEGIDQAWFRVVFEKPFGRDLKSAEELANQLSLFLNEEEIYRVDHYMGKLAVQAIIPFRLANEPNLDKIWNDEYIESIEIAMKETEDCEGRTAFYENYGVIRDVFQNHLTQILSLLIKDLPVNPGKRETDGEEEEIAEIGSVYSINEYGDVSKRKEALRHVKIYTEEGKHSKEQSIGIGQYNNYLLHATDGAKKMLGEYKTNVPTSAAIALGSHHVRWDESKFIFKAGKALDERTSYAKVKFRNSDCTLLFNIQGGSLKDAAIAYNKNKCQKVFNMANSKEDAKNSNATPDNILLKAPEGWAWKQGEESMNMEYDMVMEYIPSYQPNAYEVVIEKVINGDKGMFADTEELLYQWQMWEPVLQIADRMEPEKYDLGFNVDLLLSGSKHNNDKADTLKTEL